MTARIIELAWPTKGLTTNRSNSIKRDEEVALHFKTPSVLGEVRISLAIVEFASSDGGANAPVAHQCAFNTTPGDFNTGRTSDGDIAPSMTAYSFTKLKHNGKPVPNQLAIKPDTDYYWNVRNNADQQQDGVTSFGLSIQFSVGRDKTESDTHDDGTPRPRRHGV